MRRRVHLLPQERVVSSQRQLVLSKLGSRGPLANRRQQTEPELQVVELQEVTTGRAAAGRASTQSIESEQADHIELRERVVAIHSEVLSSRFLVEFEFNQIGAILRGDGEHIVPGEIGQLLGGSRRGKQSHVWTRG